MFLFGILNLFLSIFSICSSWLIYSFLFMECFYDNLILCKGKKKDIIIIYFNLSYCNYSFFKENVEFLFLLLIA